MTALLVGSCADYKIRAVVRPRLQPGAPETKWRMEVLAATGTNGNLFTSPPDEIYWRIVADVAELADAPDSKSGTRKSVWVRPPPSAPCKSTTYVDFIDMLLQCCYTVTHEIEDSR